MNAVEERVFVRFDIKIGVGEAAHGQGDGQRGFHIAAISPLGQAFSGFTRP
jgi:hypothetical protein